MSRIGVQPVEIPEGVTVTIEDRTVSVKGPKGELSFSVPSAVQVEQKEEEGVVFSVERPSVDAALWGTARSRVANLVEGVTKGFEKKLIVEGVGYRVQASGRKVTLTVGFSHPVELEAPEGVDVVVEEATITVSGIDKQLVGQFAADIRKVRPVEPYKGKGIKYIDEHVRRKVGKRVVGGGSPGA